MDSRAAFAMFKFLTPCGSVLMLVMRGYSFIYTFSMPKGVELRMWYFGPPNKPKNFGTPEYGNPAYNIPKHSNSLFQ